MHSSPQIIAEIGQAHEGSLGIAHSYIDALAGSGIDAIKWQLHFAESESSQFEPFRKKFSYEDKTRFDYWKRMEFTPEQWLELKNHSEGLGIEFLATPFSNYAVDVLEKLGVKRYKVGSGDVGNYLLLEKLRNTKKPVILSSGMSDWQELDKSVEFFTSKGLDVSLLQCTTSYPTQPQEWGLNLIHEMKKRYKLPVGFSDHSGDVFACLAAATLGANILEFHVIFDKKMFGPDSTSSLEISEVIKLVEGVRAINKSLSSSIIKDASKYGDLRTIFGKSLCVNKNMKKGDVIEFHHLEGKKPLNKGLESSEFDKIIGKKVTRDISKWDFINWEDLEI